MKIKDLASNAMIGNECPIERYSGVKDPCAAHNQVVDLVISGLPNDAKPEHLKQLCGAKHVVDVTVEQDTIRNICTGQGKIKVRLGDGEDAETVKMQFIKAGLNV